MTLERCSPAPFSAAVPGAQPSICATDGASTPLLLCIFMHIRANVVFHNAFALRRMQTSENAAILTKRLFFRTLRTLCSRAIFQLPYFHWFADSCFALLRKSENQLLCFHARAHDFVDMWGVSKILENLKLYFCFAFNRRNSAVHSTAVIARASLRRVGNTDVLIKEPQWS